MVVGEHADVNCKVLLWRGLPPDREQMQVPNDSPANLHLGRCAQTAGHPDESMYGLANKMTNQNALPRLTAPLGHDLPPLPAMCLDGTSNPPGT